MSFGIFTFPLSTITGLNFFFFFPLKYNCVNVTDNYRAIMINCPTCLLRITLPERFNYSSQSNTIKSFTFKFESTYIFPNNVPKKHLQLRSFSFSIFNCSSLNCINIPSHHCICCIFRKVPTVNNSF